MINKIKYYLNHEESGGIFVLILSGSIVLFLLFAMIQDNGRTVEAIDNHIIESKAKEHHALHHDCEFCK